MLHTVAANQRVAYKCDSSIHIKSRMQSQRINALSINAILPSPIKCGMLSQGGIGSRKGRAPALLGGPPATAATRSIGSRKGRAPACWEDRRRLLPHAPLAPEKGGHQLCWEDRRRLLPHAPYHGFTLPPVLHEGPSLKISLISGTGSGSGCTNSFKSIGIHFV